MVSDRAPSPKMEWARFNLRIWREESDKFRRLSPDDRRLAAALYLHASAEGFIVDTPLALALAAWEDDTARAAEIREKLPSFGFECREGKWFEENALKVYDKARSRSLVNRANGSAGGTAKAKTNAVANATANALASASPSPSPSPSFSSYEKDTVQEKQKEQGTVAAPRQLSLVPADPEPEAIASPKEVEAAKLAESFLAARHMRLHGWKPGEPPKRPSPGMLRDVTERMRVLIREGFEPALLASLPVLVAEEALDFMLRKDALVLLRTDNQQGGKCHARRYEGQLAGLTLNRRQVAILRNIGTADYVKASGAKGEW